MNNLQSLLDELKLSGAGVHLWEEPAEIRTWYVMDGSVKLVTSTKTLTFDKSTALEELRAHIAAGHIDRPATPVNGSPSTKPQHTPADSGSVAVGHIYKTTNYARFRLHEKNRQVNDLHVKKLREAIQKNNLLSGQPILVNEAMDVIDGQHRLEAARQLGVAIYYVQQKGLTIEDAIDLNINTKNWGYQDYLDYWISQGNEDYIYYKKYKERYGMSWSISISLLHKGETGTRNTRDIFIGGEFEAQYSVYAERIGRLTQLLSRYGDFSTDRSLIRALDSSIRSGMLDPFLLLKKVKMVPDKFSKCSDTESYLMMLESVINHYQKGQRIRLF